MYFFVLFTIIKNLYVFSVLSGSPKWNVMVILHNVYQRCMTILFGDENEILLFLDTCVFLSSFMLHALAKYYFNILISVTRVPVKYFLQNMIEKYALCNKDSVLSQTSVVFLFLFFFSTPRNHETGNVKSLQ